MGASISSGSHGNTPTSEFSRVSASTLVALLASLVLYLAIAGIGKAATYKHRFPHWWYLQAICIHRHESVDWRAATGNGYFGGLQFLLSTWRSVGGRGYPHRATPNQQYYRAWLVWSRDGGSWSEWGTAGMCGLR